MYRLSCHYHFQQPHELNGYMTRGESSCSLIVVYEVSMKALKAYYISSESEHRRDGLN
jgi:hypothetical protein